MIALLAHLALTPIERDALPIPRYLDEVTVSAAIAAVPWSSCPGGAAQVLSVCLRVDPVGRVLVDDLPQQPCVVGLLRAISLGPHDEELAQIALDLPITPTQVGPPLAVRLLSRPVDPLFLWTPLALSVSERRALLMALGLQSDGWAPAVMPAAPHEGPAGE
jgi:hypothetical protein